MSKQPIQVQQVIQRTEWHGPLPPPAEIEKLQKLLPSAAERLFAMAEQEQKSRQELARRESERLEEESRNYHKRTTRGQIIGAIVALAFLAGAVACAYFKQTAIGVAIVGATIVGLVNALVSPKR